MKPEFIGVGNFDTDNYVYAYCKCNLPADYAIKWPRIKDGKPHRYACECEDCGTEVGVISKSYGPNCYKKKMVKHTNCKETAISIPYLMHKEMGIPISECREAYNLAIEYLQNKSTAKG